MRSLQAQRKEAIPSDEVDGGVGPQHVDECLELELMYLLRVLQYKSNPEGV